MPGSYPLIPELVAMTDRLMGHIHAIKYYSATKKDEILPFPATWMDLEGVTPSKGSQTEKDIYCCISLTCGIKTHRYREENRGRWWGAGLWGEKCVKGQGRGLQLEKERVTECSTKREDCSGHYTAYL